MYASQMSMYDNEFLEKNSLSCIRKKDLYFFEKDYKISKKS